MIAALGRERRRTLKDMTVAKREMAMVKREMAVTKKAQEGKGRKSRQFGIHVLRGPTAEPNARFVSRC